MPYSESAKFEHHRQKNPNEFQKKSFKTVPLSHTKYRGKKFKKKGTKAIVGKKKKSGKWGIQSILVPKKHK